MTKLSSKFSFLGLINDRGLETFTMSQKLWPECRNAVFSQIFIIFLNMPSLILLNLK